MVYLTFWGCTGTHKLVVLYGHLDNYRRNVDSDIAVAISSFEKIIMAKTVHDYHDAFLRYKIIFIF